MSTGLVPFIEAAKILVPLNVKGHGKVLTVPETSTKVMAYTLYMYLHAYNSAMH